jgi:hypothetical protein
MTSSLLGALQQALYPHKSEAHNTTSMPPRKAQRRRWHIPPLTLSRNTFDSTSLKDTTFKHIDRTRARY